MCEEEWVEWDIEVKITEEGGKTRINWTEENELELTAAELEAIPHFAEVVAERDALATEVEQLREALEGFADRGRLPKTRSRQ